MAALGLWSSLMFSNLPLPVPGRLYFVDARGYISKLKEPHVALDPQATSEDSPSTSNSSCRQKMDGHIFKPGSGFCIPPSSETEEDFEIAYTSQTVLLETSTSSSSTDIAVEYSSEEQCVGCGACSETTSNSSTEWESSNSDSQSIERKRDYAKSSSIKILPHHHQGTVENISFTYKYINSSKEVIQAAHNLRYPAETHEWAVEYLLTPCPAKRKRE